MNITLFGKRVFEDVINALEKKSLLRIVPCMECNHIRERGTREDHGDRDWNDAATNQQKHLEPSETGRDQKLNFL